MAVVIETTLGDITVDLFLKERPRACQNFLKLCKMKYYNYNLFHTVSTGFIAQTGDPTGSRNGGESIFGVLEGPLKRFFVAETNPRIKHTIMGLVSFVGNDENMIGSQFFFTLGDELTYLDGKHCVFGQVTEGLDVLELINEAICDSDDRPYQDIRITHTIVLDDPLPKLEGMIIPSRSPSPSAERLQGGRIAPDEEIDETAGKSMEEVNEIIAEREAQARATILEMVGDLPDAEMAPPENVLFVCKLNPVTSDDDLEIIFSRFGKIKSCEVIRDHKSGDSLQYAFVEFEEQKSCEDAYFKMDNVLIDDRRIHVDFSQSVSKVKWMGKGRGVKHFDEKGDRKSSYRENDKNAGRNEKRRNYSRSRSPEQRRYSNSRVNEKRNYNVKEYQEKGRMGNKSDKRNYHKSPPSSPKYQSARRYKEDKRNRKESPKRNEKNYKSDKSKYNTDYSYSKSRRDTSDSEPTDEEKISEKKLKYSSEDRYSNTKRKSKQKQRDRSSSSSSDKKRNTKSNVQRRTRSSSPERSPRKEKKVRRDQRKSVSCDRDENRKENFGRESRKSRNVSKSPQRSRKKEKSKRSSSSDSSVERKERSVEKRSREYRYLKNGGKSSTSKENKSRSRRSSSSSSSSSPVSRKSKKKKY